MLISHLNVIMHRLLLTGTRKGILIVTQSYVQAQDSSKLFLFNSLCNTKTGEFKIFVFSDFVKGLH